MRLYWTLLALALAALPVAAQQSLNPPSFFGVSPTGVTGTGNIVLSAAPTFTGTATFATVSSGAVGVVNTALPVVGIYRPSAGTLGFSTASTAAGNIDSSQNWTFPAQINAPNVTQTSVAQTGTLCWATSTGAFTVDTTVACLASSARFKMDDRPLDIGLDAVMRMRPVSYELKPEFNPTHLGRQVGLMAEEVGEIDDRLIAHDNDGLPRGVRYMQMVAVLVRAIQEQQAEIADLKRRLSVP